MQPKKLESSVISFFTAHSKDAEIGVTDASPLLINLHISSKLLLYRFHGKVCPGIMPDNMGGGEAGSCRVFYLLERA